MTTLTADYGRVPHTDPGVRETVIAEAPSKTLARRIIRFVEKTAGWTCAGSRARWDDACYAVLFDEDGAVHGRRFAKREDAEAMFKAWTH